MYKNHLKKKRYELLKVLEVGLVGNEGKGGNEGWRGKKKGEKTVNLFFIRQFLLTQETKKLVCYCALFFEVPPWKKFPDVRHIFLKFNP